MEYTTGIVYEIPLTCGSSHVGQSGKCVNDHAREHAASTKTTPSGHLAVHCSRCPCAPLFHNTKILDKYKSKVSREICEAFEIERRGSDYISEASSSLSTDEYEFLKRGLGKDEE